MNHYFNAIFIDLKLLIIEFLLIKNRNLISIDIY